MNVDFPVIQAGSKQKCGFASSLIIRLFAFSNEWDADIDEKQFEKPKETLDKDLKNFYDFLYR